MKFILDNWVLIAIALASAGMLLWPILQGSMTGGGLGTAAAVQLMNREKAVLIDVCEPEEYAASHAMGAKNVPLGQLEAKLPSLVKNKNLPVLLICAKGARASRAVPIVQKLGYAQAQAISGGLAAWKEANLPLETAAS